MSLIFVDCEAWGGCPATGELTEFGAVEYKTRVTFHGVLVETTPSEENPAVPCAGGHPTEPYRFQIFYNFDAWLKQVSSGRPVFISDNVAFDWQWINDGFHRTLGRTPFGHSGRRISDFYAGLTGDFRNTQRWKRLRVTPHDHNPVHDALGNAEAFARILAGER
jgi:DNA polymerase III epsilon subunit-like protein